MNAPEVGRRAVLRAGGLAGLAGLAGLGGLAAVVAACDGGRKPTVRPAIGTGRTTLPPPAPTTTSTTVGEPDPARSVDALILQTASSIEHYAVGVYTAAAGLDVVKPGDLLDTLQYFADQHSQHAAAFEAATLGAGGRAYTEPNAALGGSAMTALSALTSEVEVLRFAYRVEQVAAATYAASAGQFSNPDLNALVMSVGSVDARHLVVLGTYIERSVGVTGDGPGGGAGRAAMPAYWSAGFQPLDGAVAPGAGI